MKLKYIVATIALTGAVMAAPKATEPVLASIPDWLDTDGDGKLSEAERQAFAQSRKEARGAARKGPSRWDTDGDGTVSQEEREAAVAALKAKVDERRCELFEGVAGEDGILSLEEFAALRAVGRVPEATIARLYGLLDEDGDGNVSKEEFVNGVGKGATPPGPVDTPAPDKPEKPDRPDKPGKPDAPEDPDEDPDAPEDPSV